MNVVLFLLIIYIPTVSLQKKNRFMLLPICLLKCWLYVYILLNICPAFMSICLPFLLYVCGFFSKDHAYTSIEDSMAIGDPRVISRCKTKISLKIRDGSSLFFMAQVEAKPVFFGLV